MSGNILSAAGVVRLGPAARKAVSTPDAVLFLFTLLDKAKQTTRAGPTLAVRILALADRIDGGE